MGGIQPIYDPDAVTPEWLSEVLPGDDPVVGCDREEIGTGQVGSNIRFRLRHASGAEGSIVGKFAAKDEVSRAAGIATRTYETEVAAGESRSWSACSPAIPPRAATPT